ncbi:SGNH/GDSL hydrolase family protein [Tessaracoccus antarcticus]|uniref:SGNH/GDSL hydrolase family protein n=1 Tax=Tessaracoccus antarcticus TaxID=2479848 RepID=UPI0011C4701B|nr:SGNH/GDSL hydrolase family protein [Tessaracoccus antarcticus]
MTNLSTPGRGYLKKPASCEIAVCANFEGTIPAIVAATPDVVVTFGGAADGDRDLSDAAREYYAALREALPDAEIIAISPVTSEDEAAYWLTMHKRTIRTAVEAVDGTFIDVGQPGVGDGEYLSAAAQAEIAATVIKELS